MTAVMEARDLKRHYAVGGGAFRKPVSVRAVDGVSFTLGAGTTLAIVGESGCGKSTLGRMLALLEDPTAGELLIDGRVTDGERSAKDPALRRAVQMVFQNPYGSLNPRQTVGRILEEPLAINTRLTSAGRVDAARAMLAKVGLRPDHYGRYPHMFSGGQRQRIAIARALMLNPRIVIADEPVSALDVSIQGQILNLLMDLQDEFKLAYLFVSHDLGVVHHIADEVMVLYLGRTAEHGPTEDVFERPLHPYTMGLLASRPKVEVGVRGARAPLSGELPSPLNLPPGCAFHRRCPYAKDRCAVDRPDPRPVFGRPVACHYAEEIAYGQS